MIVDAKISAPLASYIATRDRRLAKLTPWSPTPLADAFSELLTKGAVEVGGRSTCGAGAADPTWVRLGLWNEVVRKARSLGYAIEEVSIKQPNAWATKARGFWQESEFRLADRMGVAA